MNNAPDENTTTRRRTRANGSVPRVVARATAGVAAATGGCALAVTGLYALAAYTRPAPVLPLAGLAAIYVAYIAALRLALGPRRGSGERRRRTRRRSEQDQGP